MNPRGSTSTSTYWRVSPRFFDVAVDEAWSDDAKLLGLYLLAGPHRRTEGLFRLPLEYAASDLTWTLERLGEALREVLDKGFAKYDAKARVVFLPKALKYQRPDNPNQVKAALRAVADLPKTTLLLDLTKAASEFAPAFSEALLEAFPEAFPKGFRKGLEEGLDKGYMQPPTPTPTPTPSPTPSRTTVDEAPVEDEEEEGKGRGEKLRNRPTCDGEPCRVRELRAGIRNDVGAIVGADHIGELYNPKTNLAKGLGDLAGRVCEEVEEFFVHVPRPERDTVCRECVASYVKRARHAHEGKKIRSLAAYAAASAAGATHLGDLAGDDVVDALRSRYKSDPKAKPPKEDKVDTLEKLSVAAVFAAPVVEEES